MLPAAYRRDRGVALSRQAARARLRRLTDRVRRGSALEALGIARASGSGPRSLGMIAPVAASLTPYRGIEVVARLRSGLAESQAV